MQLGSSIGNGQLVRPDVSLGHRLRLDVELGPVYALLSRGQPGLDRRLALLEGAPRVLERVSLLPYLVGRHRLGLVEGLVVSQLLLRPVQRGPELLELKLALRAIALQLLLRCRQRQPFPLHLCCALLPRPAQVLLSLQVDQPRRIYLLPQLGIVKDAQELTFRDRASISHLQRSYVGGDFCAHRHTFIGLDYPGQDEPAAVDLQQGQRLGSGGSHL